MLQPQTSAHLAEFFLTFASIESQIEFNRLKTAQLDDFEPYSSFKKMDKQNLGYVTIADLSIFLTGHGIKLSESDIGVFIEFFDAGPEQRLSCANFLGAVLPTTNLVLRQVAARRHTYLEPARKFLEFHIDQRLADLLQIEITLYNKISVLSQSLTAMPDWDVYKAYCLIDSEKAGFIDRFCVIKFLKKHSKVASSFEDLLPLFRRIDTDNDGKLSYPEFQAIFGSRPNHSYQKNLPTRVSHGIPLKRITFSPLNRIVTNSVNSKTGNSHGQFLYESNETGSEKSLGDDWRSSNFKSDLVDDLHQIVTEALKRSQETRAKSFSRPKSNLHVINTQDVMEPQEFSASIPQSSPKRKEKLQFASTRTMQSLTKAPYQYSNCNFLNQSLQTLDTASKPEHSFDASVYPKYSYDSTCKTPNYSFNKDTQTIKIPDNPAMPDVSMFNERNDYIQLIPSQRRRSSAIRMGSGRIVGNFDNKKLASFQDQGIYSRNPSSPSHQERERFFQHGAKNKDMVDRSRSSEKPGTEVPYFLNHSQSNPNESMQTLQQNYRAPGRFKHQRNEKLPLRNDTSSARRSLRQQRPNTTKYDDELKCIAEALKEIAEATHQVDSIRKILAYQSDFTILAAYNLLLPDHSKTNSCSLEEFQRLLDKWSIKIENQSIRAVFEQFDADQDGILGVGDFEKLAFPRDFDAVQVLEGRKVTEIHKKETFNLIGQLISTAAKTALEIENIRQRLYKKLDLRLGTALRSLDMPGSEFLGIDVLKQLVESFFGELKKSTFESLLMRYNLNANDKLSLKELVKDLTPNTMELKGH